MENYDSLIFTNVSTNRNVFGRKNFLTNKICKNCSKWWKNSNSYFRNHGFWIRWASYWAHEIVKFRPLPNCAVQNSGFHELISSNLPERFTLLYSIDWKYGVHSCIFILLNLTSYNTYYTYVPNLEAYQRISIDRIIQALKLHLILLH